MDVIQNLLSMNLGLDLLWSENLLNDAFFVDEISGAEDADGLSAAGYLFAPAAEFLQQGGLGISNKRELQALGFCKLLLQRLLVLAHADDLVTGCCQFLLMSLQRAGLGSASAGVSLRITVEYYLATAILACLDLTSVLVNAKNLWYSISYIHNFIFYIYLYMSY